MDDDFGGPRALAALFDLARDINKFSNEGYLVGRAQELLQEMAGVLGLTLQEGQRQFEAGPFVDLLIDIRTQLRAAKQWQLADTIRKRLSELGISLEDTPQGTKWRQEK